jgi:Ca2+-binding RTX toxin-like protein
MRERMSQVGTDASDVITASHNTVYGLDGNDAITSTQLLPNLYGGEGNDSLGNQGSGVGYLYGGTGDDTAHGGTNPDFLYGEIGNDLLVGGEFSYATAINTGAIVAFNGELSHSDTAHGGDGTDALYGLDGDDYLYGGEGNDGFANISLLNPFTMNTTFSVASGLYGGAGNDFLDGGRGTDYLDGGTGDDTMHGGADNDTFIVDSVADIVVEGGGGGTLDIVITSGGYALGSNTDVERLTTNNINANINFNLIGNEIGQEIWGNAGRNRIAGNGGVDILKGYGGNDTFIFANIQHSNPGSYDFIQDFEDYGDDDTIDLSGFVGTLSFIGSGAFTGLNQVRAYQSGSHVIVQINTIHTTTADGHFVLTNTQLANVTASDFIL